MPLTLPTPPRFSPDEVKRFAAKLCGLNVVVKPLVSAIDQNFHLIDESSREYVFKIANSGEPYQVLAAQNAAMVHLAAQDAALRVPRVCKLINGDSVAKVEDREGNHFHVRLLTFVQGAFFAELPSHSPKLLHSLGHFVARMDKALQSFHHHGAARELRWDLKNAAHMGARTKIIANEGRRALVEYFMMQFETNVQPLLHELCTSVIHHDCNDYNLLVSDGERVDGVIDFGDLVHTCTVFELAIACAYAILHQPDPVAAASLVVQGYHEILALTERELELLYYMITARLCFSVIIAAHDRQQKPENEYVSISENAVWQTLATLLAVNPERAHRDFRRAYGLPAKILGIGLGVDEILTGRERHIGRSLSISYRKPLQMVRGAMQYLFDSEGRTYLDCVNNVAHVGHCHPVVVRAIQRQAAALNTNTRYLHENLVRYAERLTATLPEPLRVCYFVNSGSEANDLALRLARAHTGRRNMIVIDGAYHGTTIADIEMSPYKFSGPGGAGRPPHVHVVSMPDVYRGGHKADDPHAGAKYAKEVLRVLDELSSAGQDVAAFIGESLLSCGGQIVLPPGYLQQVYRHIREAGGVCIADEVQVGFARVGTHFWGFETQGVVPDIVTLGKPIGNGHPVAAVITTPEIAASFANGMEYFNTFGGNPVSCAAGLAVLDVISEERLQENALARGEQLLQRLRDLQNNHELIGDVRGLGLFVGVELVRDHRTLEPAAREASEIVERMKERGILLSTDGPLHNVIKIKPPMVFNEDNVGFLVSTLAEVLQEIEF